jgi:hypothetical protein
MDYTFDVIHHLIVPKADHPIALRLQISCSFCAILVLLQMLTAIEFDNEFGFGRAEVRDILAHRVLTTEGHS